MHLIPPVPDTRPPLDHRNDLLRHAVRKHGPPGPLVILLLLDHLQDPVEGRAPALARLQGDGDFERAAAAGEALEAAELDEGRNRVDGQAEIEDRVEGQVRGGRVAGEERAGGVEAGRGGGAEVVEDHGHVLGYILLGTEEEEGGVR